MLDYYEILGLSRDADQESIKKSYREAAFRFHPDRNPGDASCEERFKKINEAYSILSDEEKKLQYDMRLNNPGLDSAAYQNPFGGYNSPWPPNGGPDAEWREPPFTFYTYTWRNTEDPNPPRNAWTRKTAMEQLLRNIATVLLGIFLFRYSLLFGILGFIVCLSVIGRGLIGSLQAVRFLFTSK